MLEQLWHTLPLTPLLDLPEEDLLDELPDAQHDLSPRTLGQHIISGPRIRGEVPSHLRQADSGSSGAAISPSPQ
eukprot:4936143-Amphidinium_carterae.1